MTGHFRRSLLSFKSISYFKWCCFCYWSVGWTCWSWSSTMVINTLIKDSIVCDTNVIKKITWTWNAWILCLLMTIVNLCSFVISVGICINIYAGMSLLKYLYVGPKLELVWCLINRKTKQWSCLYGIRMDHLLSLNDI